MFPLFIGSEGRGVPLMVSVMNWYVIVKCAANVKCCNWSYGGPKNPFQCRVSEPFSLAFIMRRRFFFIIRLHTDPNPAATTTATTPWGSFLPCYPTQGVAGAWGVSPRSEGQPGKCHRPPPAFFLLTTESQQQQTGDTDDAGTERGRLRSRNSTVSDEQSPW